MLTSKTISTNGLKVQKEEWGLASAGPIPSLFYLFAYLLTQNAITLRMCREAFAKFTCCYMREEERARIIETLMQMRKHNAIRFSSL